MSALATLLRTLNVLALTILLSVPAQAQCGDHEYEPHAASLHIVAIDGERINGTESLILRNQCMWTWRRVDGWYSDEKGVFIFSSKKGVAPWGGIATYDEKTHTFRFTHVGTGEVFTVAPRDDVDQSSTCPLWPLC